MVEDLAAVPHDKAEGGASPEAIQAHYDVSNDFYALWLDSTMAYSCALWEAGDTLKQAQLRKLDFHLTQAQATNKSNLLDVGCGWGALLDRAVTHYNVKNVVGLTLSQAQADWVTHSKRDSVSVLLESWRDHRPTTPYDAIVSIGAFEHFAKAGLSKLPRPPRIGTSSDGATTTLRKTAPCLCKASSMKTTTRTMPTHSLKVSFPSRSCRAYPRFSRPAKDCLKWSCYAMIACTMPRPCNLGTPTCARIARRPSRW